MECTWFFGGDLRTATILISLLGIVHPVFWVLAARRFRSEWFLALYVLAGAWSLVSCLLLAGVLAKLEVLYWVWIWFSLVFAPLMALGMLLMAGGFLVLRMPRLALYPAVGLVYYILTLYCICVVDTQRRAAHAHAHAHAPRAAHPPGRTLAVLREASETTTTARLTPTIKPPRRGRCAVPERNPANGVYMAALSDNRVAQPGRQYHRLRLWVYCDKFYRPRHLQYAFCYSGGWNLPLPDCVKDASYYEEYYEDFPTTTTARPTQCVLPRPPAHGYFAGDAKLTRRYMQLSVRCNPLHFLVGWQRITCHDGVWDRPVPNCVFVDSSVCTLVVSDNRMIRTCLSSTLYAGTYRCERGIVPHGAVVESRCPRNYYVWGTFDYLYCVNGIWHPRQLVNNITCEYAADIYRHYEIEEFKNKTMMATADPAHDVREQDSMRHAVTIDPAVDPAADNAADHAADPAAHHAADAAADHAADPAADHAADPAADPAADTTATANQTHSDAAVLSGTKVTKTTHQVSSFISKINTTDIWKAENETDGFFSSNTATIKIWATQGTPSDLLSTTSNKNIISSYQKELSRLPTTSLVSTSRRQIDITDIWKGPIDAEETTGVNFAEKNIWNPLPVGALIDNLIKPDKVSETGAHSDSKPAKVDEWPSQRDRDWFSADAAQFMHETEEVVSFDDGFNLNTRSPRVRDEGLSSTWKSRQDSGDAIQMDIWQSDIGTDDLQTISP